MQQDAFITRNHRVLPMPPSCTLFCDLCKSVSIFNMWKPAMTQMSRPFDLCGSVRRCQAIGFMTLVLVNSFIKEICSEARRAGNLYSPGRSPGERSKIRSERCKCDTSTRKMCRTYSASKINLPTWGYAPGYTGCQPFGLYEDVFRRCHGSGGEEGRADAHPFMAFLLPLWPPWFL